MQIFLEWCRSVVSVLIGPEVQEAPAAPRLHHSSAALFESSSATAQSKRWTPGSARSLSFSFSRNDVSSRLFKWSVRVLSSSTRSLVTLLPDSSSSASVSALSCGGTDRGLTEKPFVSSTTPACSVRFTTSGTDSVSICDINVVCRAAFSSSFRRLLWRQWAVASFPLSLLLLPCSIMLCVTSAVRSDADAGTALWLWLEGVAPLWLHQAMPTGRL